MSSTYPLWGYALLAASVVGTGAASSAGLLTDARAGTTAARVDSLLPAKIDFADALPLVIDRVDGDAFVATVFIKNDEAGPQQVSLSLNAVNGEGAVLERPLGTKPIPEPGVVSVSLRIPRDQDVTPPLTGHLILRARARADGPVAVRLKPFRVLPALPSRLADCIVVSSLAAAAAAAIFAAGSLWGQVSATTRMGSPSWTFSDSWGSNIALGGALLTQLLSLLLPEHTHYLNKAAYTVLSLLFGALITAAPAVYSLLRTPVAGPDPSAPVQHQGFVGVFVLASVFTLWGAFGQLSTVGMLFAELFRARHVSPWTLVAVVGVLVVLALALFAYAVRTICALARAQKAHQERALPTDVVPAPAPAAAAAPAAELLPGWTLI